MSYIGFASKIIVSGICSISTYVYRPFEIKREILAKHFIFWIKKNALKPILWFKNDYSFHKLLQSK